MRKSRFFELFWLGCALGFAPVSAGADGVLTADVSPRRPIPGDPVRISVVYQGGENNLSNPVFENEALPELQGPSVSRNYSSFNGMVEQSVSWVYSLIPEGTGTVSLGTVRLTAGGETLRARLPELFVAPPPPQPWVRLSLESSAAEVLVEERFTVSLHIDVLSPTGTVFAAAPLVPREPPMLRLPHVAGDGPAGPAQPEFAVSDWLGEHRARDGVGFTVENVTAGASDPFDPFSLLRGNSLFNRETPVFSFPSTNLTENGTAWIRYTLTTPWRSTGEGAIRFPAVRLRGHVVAEETGEPVRTPDFTVLTEPLTVRVVPPPEAGRPASFIGALSRTLQAELALNAQTCRQGDPLELTLTFSGAGLVPSTVREPDLFADPALSGAFRAYGNVTRTADAKGVRFVYRLRPLEAGTLEIPSFPFAFFNTQTRAYEEIRSAPVPIRVDPVADFNADSLFAASATGNGGHPDTPAGAPSGITVRPDAAQPRPPLTTPSRALLILLLPPLAAGVAGVWHRTRRGGRQLAAAVRRGTALDRAAARIRKAETPEAVLHAVARLLRERYGIRRSGLTPDEVLAILKEQQADEAVAAEIGQRLSDIFEARFRQGGDPAAAVRAHRERLATLFGMLRILLLVCSLALPLAAAAATASSAATAAAATGGDTAAHADFRWRRANAQAAAAQTPEAWAEVARLYRELITPGRARAPLYHNYGIALLHTRNRALAPAALDALRRAEALDGATPELENDLRLAYAAVRTAQQTPATAEAAGAAAEAAGAAEEAAGAAEEAAGAPVATALPDAAALSEAMPWYRTLLSAHYRLSRADRLAALAAAWVLLWAALLLRRGALRRTLLVLALLTLAVLGTSLLASERVLRAPLPSWEQFLS